MKFLTLPLIVFAALVFAFAPAVAQDSDNLVGTQWQLVSYASGTPVTADSYIILEFGAENQVLGFGGCNTYNGLYSVDGSTITFSEIISTRKSCIIGADVTMQEQAYLGALPFATAYEITDDQLTITYDDGQLVFIKVILIPGSHWRLQSYGDPAALTDVVADSTVTLEFDREGQVTGNGGCNGYGGSYRLEDDTIQFSQVVSTLIACVDEAITAQEQAYFEALQSATTYEITDDQLIITYGDGQQLVFTRVSELTNATWILTSYGAEIPTVPDSLVTIEFGDNNLVSGSGGCNAFSGNYEINGDTIIFSNFNKTVMACAGVDEQEQAFMEGLQTATTYEITGDQLIITYGDGQRLVFSRSLTPVSF